VSECRGLGFARERKRGEGQRWTWKKRQRAGRRRRHRRRTPQACPWRSVAGAGAGEGGGNRRSAGERIGRLVALRAPAIKLGHGGTMMPPRGSPHCALLCPRARARSVHHGPAVRVSQRPRPSPHSPPILVSQLDGTSSCMPTTVSYR
jgi:hypothetical protein